MHVSVECVEIHKEDTPEEKTIAPRIVLIMEDGQSYACVSVGVFQSLKRMFTLLGTPDTWAEPSLSARRAWIEMVEACNYNPVPWRRSPQGERG